MATLHLRAVAALNLFILSLGITLGQQAADPQAEVLLNTARKAYADSNYTFAAEKFREFFTKFGAHKDVNAARYGLGLALLDLPDRDYQKALEAFTPAANDAKFADRSLALYYAGVSRRGLGQKELAEGIAKPNEMPQRQKTPTPTSPRPEALYCRLARRSRRRIRPMPSGPRRRAATPPRWNCGSAKMKEARATAEPFVKDANFAKSKFRPLGLYYHGFACFLLNDIPAAAQVAESTRAVRSAVRPARPLPDGPRSMPHRTRTPRPPPRSTPSSPSYEEQKKPAVEALQAARPVQERPVGEVAARGACEGPGAGLRRGRGVLRRVPELRGRQVRRGAAEVPGVRQGVRRVAAEGRRVRCGPASASCRRSSSTRPLKTLQPLAAHPKLGDQAMYWLGKAQARQAAATDPEQRRRPQTGDSRPRSICSRTRHQGGPDGRAGRRGREGSPARDPARTRRHAADREASREAAQIYDQILATRNCSRRRRRRRCSAPRPRTTSPATSPTSEARIASFKQQFPNSPLMPLVVFRSAENAFAKAEQLAKQNNPAAAKRRSPRRRRSTTRSSRSTRSSNASTARGTGWHCATPQEDWEKAIAALEAIPAAERNGELVAGAVRARRLPHPHRTGEGRGRAAGQHAPREADRGRESARRVHRGEPEGGADARRAAEARLLPQAAGVQLAPGNERNDALNKARAAFERLQARVPAVAARRHGASGAREGDGAPGRQGRRDQRPPPVRQRPAPEVAGRAACA